MKDAVYSGSRRLSRRHVRRGAGCALALPALDAMTPAFEKPELATPRRMVAIQTNQGIMPQFFFPNTLGRGYGETDYLKVLEKHRDQLTVIRKEAAIWEAEQNLDSELTSILMFNAGNDRRMSVPLSLVSRLEEIAVDRIEHTGDSDVVQYRGDLLPLLPIDGGFAANTSGLQPVIVFSENNKTMGLMVEEIEDIIEEELVIRMQSKRPGVLGTAIVAGQATDILDAQHYVMHANPNWFENNQIEHSVSILLAEDSVFFRQLATTSLEAAGYQVTAVEDGGKAVAKLEQGATFDLIISDIEMPVMGGIEVAQWVRARDKFANTPMIALSGNTNPTLQERAIEVGFNCFMRKFDPAELKEVVDRLCATNARIQGVSA